YCSFCVVIASATPEAYTLSLHDALPIFVPSFVLRCRAPGDRARSTGEPDCEANLRSSTVAAATFSARRSQSCPALSDTYRSFSRSEEHTSELQSRENLVCRLLLEKKNRK